jgi:ATP-dependent Clp protease ATP-binding subunit ClpA
VFKRDINPSSSLLRILREAASYQKKQGDSHLAIDHLLLALADDKDVGQIFKDAGVTKQQLETAIKEVCRLFSQFFDPLFPLFSLIHSYSFTHSFTIYSY